jgi:hypothetical protein
MLTDVAKSSINFCTCKSKHPSNVILSLKVLRLHMWSYHAVSFVTSEGARLEEDILGRSKTRKASMPGSSRSEPTFLEVRMILILSSTLRR